ncbi:MAG: WD40/YVTN/BNR-like repeat-containing protein [Terriglobales bacterium]
MTSLRLRLLASLGLALLFTCGMAWAQRRGGSATVAGMQFSAIGPAEGGGRVCCVVGIPGRPDTYYVGTAGGGVWKTTDGGFHWTPIFSHYTTESIGAVALAPSNPNLVWVGTGESNVRNDVIDGHGLFFSPDGGQTFAEIGKQYFDHSGQISKIIINPHDPNEVWVAVLGHAFGPNDERGIYRTTDGGATWQRTLFINDNTGAIDLAMKPGNPRVLVAAMWQTVRHPWGLEDGGPSSGIYKSTDAGATWTELKGHGLPAQPYGRIALEFAPSQPDLLYAEIQARHGVFWRSEDSGENWTMVSNDDQLNSRPFYFSRFAVMPTNPDAIYFLSVRMSYSADGGRTSRPAGITLHSDHHSLWMDPTNPSRMIEGDDGGVNFSHDGGLDWIHVTNLPVEEGYSVHADSERPYHLCVGLQDNDAFCGPSQADAWPNQWLDVVGGDGEYAVPAPSDPNILYTDSQEGDAERRDMRTGLSTSVKPMPNFTSGETNYVYAMPARFNWTTPIEVSATDSNVVYMGANRLYKSVDGGHSWVAISPDLTLNDKSKQQASGGVVDLDMTGAETADTILSFAVSRLDPNTIWVGTDDGVVQVTRDGGKTWSKVSDNIQGLKPWGRLQEMDVSPFDPNTAYIAYDRHEMNDSHPYVYKTHDGGKTWTEIDAGLPGDYVAHVIREDPNQKGLLVLGTDYGLYHSSDDGATWTQIHDGFPTAVTYDLLFVKRTHSLVVCTHGRGLYVLDNITPWEQMSNPQVASAPFSLFPILPAVMFQRMGFNPLNRNPLARTAPQPPQGAVIQYRLASAVHSAPAAAALPPLTPEQQQMAAMAAQFGFTLPSRSRGPVSVDITDAAGDHVATVHGSGHAGVNEAVWGGTYDPSKVKAPASGRGGFFALFRRGGGLRALPGRYKVTVNVPGLAPQSQWVELQEDPRVKINLPALEATLKAGQAMQPDVDALNRMLNGLDGLSKQLTSMQQNLPAASGPSGDTALLEASKALAAKVSRLHHELVPPPRHEDYGGVAGFASDFNGIFREISGGFNTFPPPQDLRDWATARAKLQGYLDRYNQLLRQDVTAFNQQALAHHGITLVAGNPVTLGSAPAVLTAAAAAANR